MGLDIFHNRGAGGSSKHHYGALQTMCMQKVILYVPELSFPGSMSFPGSRANPKNYINIASFCRIEGLSHMLHLKQVGTAVASCIAEIWTPPMWTSLNRWTSLTRRDSGTPSSGERYDVKAAGPWAPCCMHSACMLHAGCMQAYKKTMRA